MTPTERKTFKRLMKSIGASGGFARARKLTPERRQQIARKAAQARWGTDSIMLIVSRGERGQSLQVFPISDAHLIAAAPDLYAAVSRALAVEQSVTQGQERELRVGYRDLLRAAIAKAEGRTP